MVLFSIVVKDVLLIVRVKPRTCFSLEQPLRLSLKQLSHSMLKENYFMRQYLKNEFYAMKQKIPDSITNLFVWTKILQICLAAKNIKFQNF